MLPIGVCAYAIPYSIGFVGRGTPRAIAQPLTSRDLIRLAKRLDLAGVEIPTSLVRGDGAPPAPADLDALRDEAADSGLAITIDTAALDAQALAHELRLAHRLGARVVRTMLSYVLCGDRRPIGGYDAWQRLLDERVQTLKSVTPLAEELDVRIGIENHQDATSQELVSVCERIGSSHVGVTLDTGNPLAVGEDPVQFARNILPHLVHVHLKDYRVARTAEGYRLYHCPIGAGVVDFVTLFGLFQERNRDLDYDLGMNLEMAMLGERHIRILAPDYWAGFGPRDINEVLPAFRLRDAAVGDSEIDPDWHTPWDTGDDATLSAWELDRLAESAGHMRRCLAQASS